MCFVFGSALALNKGFKLGQVSGLGLDSSSGSDFELGFGLCLGWD